MIEELSKWITWKRRRGAVSKTIYECSRIRIGEVKKVLIQMGLIEIAGFLRNLGPAHFRVLRTCD